MPPVVIGVVAYGAATAAGYAVATAVAIGVGAAIATYAVTEAMQPELGDMGEGAGGDQNLTVGGVHARRLIYGEAVVSGGIVGYGTYTDNESDKWHVMTIALADHECESISLYDIEGKLHDEDGMSSRFKITKYLGDQTTVCPVAKRYCDGWTNAHVGFGLSYVTLEVKIDTEFFPNGINAIRFKIQGKRLYDVRKDGTMGGVGSHRFNDATTWEYSDNPILASTDFARFGGYKEQPSNRFDWPDIAAQANSCDEIVNFTDSNGLAATEKRFTCNGTLLKSQSPSAGMQHLLSACAGKMYNVAGKIYFKVGVYQGAPTMVLDKSHAVADISYKPHTPIKERTNTVRTSFVNPKKYYQLTDAPPTENAIYKAADGMKLEQSIELKMTNSETMCQRIGKNQLEQNRSGFSLRFPMFAIGLLVMPGQAVTINLPEDGIVNAEFKCVDWAWDSKKRTAVLTFGKDDDSLYSDSFEPNEAPVIGNDFVDHFVMPAFADNAITWTDATGIRDSQGRLSWVYDENNADIEYGVELRQLNDAYISYDDPRLDPDHASYNAQLSPTNKYTSYYRKTTPEQFIDINSLPADSYEVKVIARNRMNRTVFQTKAIIISNAPADIKDMAGWDVLPSSGADVTNYNDERISNAEITGFVTDSLYASEKAVLQAQIDKSITTWFLNNVPTLSNEPAVNWSTNSDKNIHLGDLYYDNVTGYAYRFMVNTGVYQWNKVSDSDVTKALADAAKAQDTADSKRRVFVAEPVTPYDVGDLWDTGIGIMRSTVNRNTGNFVYGDWSLVSDVTDYGDDRVSNDALTIGGTNLVIGSESGNYNYASQYNTADLYKNFNVASGTLTSGTYLDFCVFGLDLDALEYTVSFMARSEQPTLTVYCHAYSPNNTTSGISSQGTVSSSSDGRMPINLTNVWTRYWITWKQSSAAINKRFILARISTSIGDQAYVAAVKLESGSKATDWSEAPEDTQAKADAAQAAAIAAADVAAQAKAELARVTAEAYADNIVTAEEARAIADATAKANAAQATAISTAAADAQAKANAAQAAAIAAADVAAQAKANLAQVTAEAYADDIVTAEEARAIADATAKANAAQALAEQYSQLTQSNQTLYSLNGIVSDVMPTGSPFALGYSRTGELNYYSPTGDGLIPVKKGETLHWEMWAKQNSNTARAYMGIERYDRNKKPIGTNNGTVYGGLINTLLPTSWTKYTFSHALPEIHTSYNGSDGKEVCFVRVRILMNYQTPGQAYYSGYRLYRVNDQQYMPNLVSAGAGTALNINPLTSQDNGSTAKITIASHTRQYGFGLLSLNAGSITGLAFGTKYYVYYDDPTYSGGAVTYQATSVLQTIAASNHRIFVSSITTATNGGGSTNPPVFECVATDMWLTDTLKACDVNAGNILDLWWQGSQSVKGRVLQASAVPAKQVTYEIQTSSGAIVRVSESTPLELNNHVIVTPKTLRVNYDKLATLKDSSPLLVWENVVRCEIIGERHVMHISVGNGSFAAGVNPNNRVITHNAQQKP
jgi:hypothetical protein